jgi:hypothetical protein
MDDPLAGVTLSQLAEGASELDIVCSCAVQFNEPAPWLNTVKDCAGGIGPPAMVEKAIADCESVSDWVAWLTAIITLIMAWPVEFASFTAIWPV